MKIKVAFAVVALFALASAFTTRHAAKKSTIWYKVSNVLTVGAQQRYQLLDNTQNASVTCDAGSNTCSIATDNTFTPSFESNGSYYYIVVGDSHITDQKTGDFF